MARTNSASESIKHAQKTGGTVIMQSTDKKETYKITPDKKLTARPSKQVPSIKSVTNRQPRIGGGGIAGAFGIKNK